LVKLQIIGLLFGEFTGIPYWVAIFILKSNRTLLSNFKSNQSQEFHKVRYRG